jgi:hypothetical protein
MKDPMFICVQKLQTKQDLIQQYTILVISGKYIDLQPFRRNHYLSGSWI